MPARRILLAAVIALVGALVAEAVLRTPLVRRRLPAPVTGGAIPELDATWKQMMRFVEQRGAPKCLLIGGTAAKRAVDADIFEAELRAETERTLPSLPFLIDKLGPPGMAVLAEIVVQEYRPEALVVVTSLPMFDEGAGASVANQLARHPWVKYRLGDPSVDGWLFEHSLLFRQVLSERHAARTSGRAEVEDHHRVADSAHLIGAAVSSWHLENLDRLMAIEDARTRVIVVEVPVHRRLLTQQPDWRRGFYEPVISEISLRASRRGVVFLETSRLALIPDSGWEDELRLNSLGARSFSRWLGENVGRVLERAP